MKAQMKLMNTNDINDVISDMIKQDLKYQRTIKLLKQAIAEYKEALNVRSG